MIEFIDASHSTLHYLTVSFATIPYVRLSIDMGEEMQFSSLSRLV
jgi:hypothetical protein